MPWFNKYYRCPCGTEWQDEWDCLCNDRCPSCDTECEPYDHAEIDEGSLTMGEGPSFILIIPKRNLTDEMLASVVQSVPEFRSIRSNDTTSDEGSPDNGPSRLHLCG